MLLSCFLLCLGSMLVSGLYKFSSLNKRQVNKKIPDQVSDTKSVSDHIWVSEPSWGWFVVID